MADFREDSEVKSAIIMKVDAPPEDNSTLTSSQGVSGTKGGEIDLIRTQAKQKKPVLASSRLNNSNPFAMRATTCNPSNSKFFSSSVLRPSQLGSKLETKPETKHQFALSPSRLNPFAKTDAANNGTELNNGMTASGDAPKFVPLVVTETTTNPVTTTPSTTSANFVFGQNLHERVVAETDTKCDSSSSGDEQMASTSHSVTASTNGTTELLFSSAAKKAAPSVDANKEVKSLSESAREYEESRANKRKYDEVVIVTGEEDEVNVLQLNCKLFAFDKATGNWQERGRGTLRLNDKDVQVDEPLGFTQSRLVIRTAGSLRVVLNTKIWAEMTLDRASPKSLRLTAMDSTGLIKVFLIMANPDEINQLYRLLNARVQNEVLRQKQLKINEPEIKKQELEESNGQ